MVTNIPVKDIYTPVEKQSEHFIPLDIISELIYIGRFFFLPPDVIEYYGENTIQTNFESSAGWFIIPTVEKKYYQTQLIYTTKIPSRLN